MVPESWEAALLRAGGGRVGQRQGLTDPRLCLQFPPSPSPACSLNITSSRVPQLTTCFLILPLNVHLGPFFSLENLLSARDCTVFMVHPYSYPVG